MPFTIPRPLRMTVSGISVINEEIHDRLNLGGSGIPAAEQCDFEDLRDFRAERNAAAALALSDRKEEILVVHRLNVPATLDVTLLGTSAIENGIRNRREQTGNVKPWNVKRDMLSRWAASGHGAVHVVVRDQAGFHLRDGDPRLPANVPIIDPSPYSPELNPCEQLWDLTFCSPSNRLHILVFYVDVVDRAASRWFSEGCARSRNFLVARWSLSSLSSRLAP